MAVLRTLCECRARDTDEGPDRRARHGRRDVFVVGNFQTVETPAPAASADRWIAVPCDRRALARARGDAQRDLGPPIFRLRALGALLLDCRLAGRAVVLLYWHRTCGAHTMGRIFV